jgi:hypothetical protein
MRAAPMLCFQSANPWPRWRTLSKTLSKPLVKLRSSDSLHGYNSRFCSRSFAGDGALGASRFGNDSRASQRVKLE